MTPPSLPPPLPEEKKSFAVPAAVASLITSVVAVIGLAIAGAITAQGTNPPTSLRMIIGVICCLLVLAGLVFGIIALCGVRRHNRGKVLAVGLPGLAINGALMCFIVIGFAQGFEKARKRAERQREATAELRKSTQELQQSLREGYDPEQGVTNFDSSKMGKLSEQLKDASKTMSGDDAIIMEAMANHVGRIQKGVKNYEPALTAFTEAQVLNAETLKEKSQIEERRKIVQVFLARNAELRQLIADSEKNIRAELTKVKMPEKKINAVMLSFNSKAAPRNALTIKIRDCDQRLGDAALGALGLFETNWGKWKRDDAAGEIRFEETSVADQFNEYIDEINSVADEQVKLQGKLVNMPQ